MLLVYREPKCPQRGALHLNVNDGNVAQKPRHAVRQECEIAGTVRRNQNFAELRSSRRNSAGILAWLRTEDGRTCPSVRQLNTLLVPPIHPTNGSHNYG